MKKDESPEKTQSTKLNDGDLKLKGIPDSVNIQSTQPIVLNAASHEVYREKGKRKKGGWKPNCLNLLELILLIIAIIVAVRSCNVSQKSLQSSEESSILLKNIETEVVKKPSLYLSVNKFNSNPKGKVDISFKLLNSGLAEATNVNIKFYMPDSLNPELYIQQENNVKEINDRILISTNDSINKCLKYSYYSDEVVYQRYRHGQPYETKLPFTLSFNVNNQFVKKGEKLSFYYIIQHSKGDTTGIIEYGIDDSTQNKK